MYRTVLASAALVAAVQAQSCGSAIVINKCSYNVYLANTPSAGGGYTQIDKTLAPGDSYSQVYTQLTNNNGWSLKLSKEANAYSSNIMQYEYTYHNDGIIWFDLSDVNGNPWDGNWEITANNGCTPRQAAYRFSTDDAYGMQACASDASVTVTLCSGDSGSGSGSAAPSSPAQTYSTPATSTSTPPPAPTTTEGHHHHGHHTWGLEGNALESPAAKVAAPKEKKPQTTLLTTASTPAAVTPWDGPAVTVTNVAYETLTQYVTATASPAKRHVHHPRHAHNRL